ncbi:MAG TPA: ribbon-helix-helix domain-containing protein [Xanthobacteraceae bacterium]|nr:ribbon-helix-helix domain-containing protein [Xanthobacteraceae bacterium]
MKSLVTKRSIVIGGHKTSVSLEEAFWKGLKEIAADRRLTLSDMVSAIDSERANGNLSSAIRLFVLDHYRGRTGAAAGPRSAGGESPVQPAGGGGEQRAVAFTR